MAKKTSSVSLEKDIWDEIEAYREKYDLSSRNVALERMLLERRMYFANQNQSSPNKPIEKESQKPEIKENSILENSILDSFKNMKD